MVIALFWMFAPTKVQQRCKSVAQQRASNARVSETAFDGFAGIGAPEVPEIAVLNFRPPFLARTQADGSVNVSAWRAADHKAVTYSRCWRRL